MRSSAWSLSLAFVVAAALSGCGVSDESGSVDGSIRRDGGTKVCTPGEEKACSCGGSMGTQICRSTGTGFDRCVCAAGSVPDGGVPGMGDTPPATGCGACNGCCNGTTCVPFPNENDTLCGKKGQACRACTGGAACDTKTGSCVTPTTGGGCNATSCPTGCCSTMGCVTSPDWSQCGTAGAACQACALAGSVCEADGTCKGNLLDENEFFYVAVRSVTVEMTDASGNDWDRFAIGFTEPDPFVCINYQDLDENNNPITLGGCTESCSDAFNCMFTQAQGLIRYCFQDPVKQMTVCEPQLFWGAKLKAGDVTATVYDYDPGNANDLVGSKKLPATTVLKTARYTSGAFERVVQIEYELLYDLP